MKIQLQNEVLIFENKLKIAKELEKKTGKGLFELAVLFSEKPSLEMLSLIFKEMLKGNAIIKSDDEIDDIIDYVGIKYMNSHIVEFISDFFSSREEREKKEDVIEVKKK